MTIESKNVLTDFPKLQCPFIRRIYKIDIDDWKKFGRQYKLRQPEVYLVTNEINPGYEWVFEDKDTSAIEKLDGINVKLLTVNGRLELLYNRKNKIDLLQVMKGKTFIVEGVFTAIQKGYVEESGEQCGELIGEKIQGNPYGIIGHIWYPFSKAKRDLSYRSWHEHERTFENLSSWFKDYLKSRYAIKKHNLSFEEAPFAEGVVFYNNKRRLEGKTYMAKLRRDMFSWFYTDRIRILC